jgi:hypothetical protein
MIKNKEVYDWLHFAQAYLKMGELGCAEIIENKHIAAQFEVGYSPAYTIHDLLIPTLYNTKHGIEVFLKSLRYTLSGKIHQEHNIHSLFQTLKEDTKRHKIFEYLIQKSKENPDDFNLMLIKNASNLKINEFFEKIEPLVKKYYSCEFFLRKIGKTNLTFTDKNNTLFRYPDNVATAKLDYQNFESGFTNNEIKDIKSDIQLLSEYFNDLGYILDIYIEYKEKE